MNKKTYSGLVERLFSVVQDYIVSMDIQDADGDEWSDTQLKDKLDAEIRYSTCSHQPKKK